ncbi:MAG: potassium channel protein [Deltaproteobacteria bacterium]|nr:potassium channel protein [Deltaproteobacteria bacterium]MBW2343869.1 potassium channel protein [Deltaproteobacteria bacterium]
MITRKHLDATISAPGPQRIVRGLIMLGMVLMMGTMGYMILERWHFLDSLYMTVITITTVGFKEVRTVSEPGRIFTVILIFIGMGIMAYTLGMVAQFMVEGEIRSILGRRKLGSRIKSLKKHYIICGYGRIGRVISHELKSHGIPVLVIDQDPESQHVLEDRDLAYIIDDATSEDVLIEAGIERAKGLVAVVLSDADNLFITMTARGLKPDLFILARADEEHARKKLLRAGADNVVLPYLMGGRKMAQSILRPAVADFLDLTIHDKDIDLNMEELQVKEVSTLNGVTLADSGIRQKMNVIIVAIRKKEGEMMFNPSFEARIEAGDTLIALGQSSELDRLAFILAGK